MFISVSLNNYVNAEMVQSVTDVSTGSSPLKKFIKLLIEQGRMVDATKGRKARSLIMLRDGHYVLSCMKSDYLSGNKCNGTGHRGRKPQEPSKEKNIEKM